LPQKAERKCQYEREMLRRKRRAYQKQSKKPQCYQENENGSLYQLKAEIIMINEKIRRKELEKINLKMA